MSSSVFDEMMASYLRLADKPLRKKSFNSAMDDLVRQTARNDAMQTAASGCLVQIVNGGPIAAFVRQKCEECFEATIRHSMFVRRKLWRALLAINLEVFDRIVTIFKYDRDRILMEYGRLIDKAARDLVLAEQGVRESNEKYGLSNSQIAGKSFVRHVVHLACFLLIESSATAPLFGLGSELGLLGGLAIGFMVTAFNVFVSYYWGMACRAAGEQNSALWRFLSWIGIAAYGAAAIIYHSIVAWYRSLLIANKPDEVLGMAHEYFFQNPITLLNTTSLFLLFVGLVFGILAFKAGYHGFVVRAGWRLTWAEKRKSRCEERRDNALKRNRKRGKRKVESARKFLHKLAVKMLSAREEARNLVVQCQKDIHWIQQSALAAADRYRGVFYKIRGCSPDFVDPSPDFSESRFALEIPEIAECEKIFDDVNAFGKIIDQRAHEALCAISNGVKPDKIKPVRLLTVDAPQD